MIVLNFTLPIINLRNANDDVQFLQSQVTSDLKKLGPNHMVSSTKKDSLYQAFRLSFKPQKSISQPIIWYRFNRNIVLIDHQPCRRLVMIARSSCRINR